MGRQQRPLPKPGLQMKIKTKRFIAATLTLLLLGCNANNQKAEYSNTSTEVKKEVFIWGNLQELTIQDAVYRARKIAELSSATERANIYRQVSQANCNDPEVFVSRPAILLAWAVTEPNSINISTDDELIKGARSLYDLYQAGYAQEYTANMLIEKAICQK